MGIISVGDQKSGGVLRMDSREVVDSSKRKKGNLVRVTNSSINSLLNIITSNTFVVPGVFEVNEWKNRQNVGLLSYHVER